jgi:protein-L-isoaspartate(D-aspartate) O-methyltransferase
MDAFIRRASTIAALVLVPMLPRAVDQAGEDPFRERRLAMVEEQIAARGVTDARVLEAMRAVPRHHFVPQHLQAAAYEDRPLPIGHEQTISQPYIVAYMTDVLGVRPEHRVLEIGTGSGYQAAVLAKLAREVYTIEIVPELARTAARALQALGVSNVHVREGDGYAGWPDRAPFDRIMVTAAPERIPQPLIDQLAPSGRLVIPVGHRHETQWITIADRTPAGVIQKKTIAVSFVPMRRRP